MCPEFWNPRLPSAAPAPARHTRPRPDQLAELQLLAGVRDPADAARHGEQGELAARGQAQCVHEDCERVVDVDEFAGGFRDALRHLAGEFARRAGARQCVQQRLRAGIAALVDAMAEAGKTLAERDALAHHRLDVAVDQRLHELRGQHAGPPCFGPFSAARPAMTES